MYYNNKTNIFMKQHEYKLLNNMGYRYTNINQMFIQFN